MTSDTVKEVQEYNSSLQVALSILILEANGLDTGRRQQGPTVVLLEGNADSSDSSKVDVLAVALLSLLGITLLIVADAIWVINRKRRGAPSMPRWVASFVAFIRGFNARTHLPDRPTVVSPSIDKGTPRYDIQLTERDSWSATSLGREPHPGRNVFREEMARQTRVRG